VPTPSDESREVLWLEEGELADLRMDVRDLGAMTVAFMFAYGVFEVPWGRLGDRYGARDLLPVTAATAAFAGGDLGRLAPVDPPVRFGFGSVPRTPALVRVVTTVGPVRGPAR